MPVISIARDTNNNVSIVRMEVSDNLATVAQTDYILNNQEMINILNTGVFDWFITDMLLVAASDGNAFFQFTDDTFTSLIIYGEQGSGVINPGLTNELAYYSANGTTLSGLTTADNGILATNASGKPSITSILPSVVQTNITQVGTINTGVWQGTNIAVGFGGTGVSSFTAYAVLCAGTTSTGNLQNVSGVGTSGQILTSNGPGTLPTWQANAASGTINTGTTNAIAYYAANGTTISPISTADSSVFVTSGLGVPSWSMTLPSGLTIPGYQTTITPVALTETNDTNVTMTLGGTPATALLQPVSMTLGWTGQLAVGRGGTGSASFNINGVVISNTTTTGALESLTLSDGQIVIGSSAGAPLAATVSSGTGISISNGHNTITISSNGANPWVDETGSSVTMATNTGYTSDDGATLVTFTLPATANIGDWIEINGKGAGGWSIAQATGQQIHFGNAATTSGTGGSLSSTNQYDCVKLRCITANTTFSVVNVIGNLTVV